MKRTKRINLDAMRKIKPLKYSLLPVSISLALTGCGTTEESRVFKTLEECIAYAPTKQSECESAYQSALSKAQQSAPKYRSRSDCESEFGYGRCNHTGSGNWFVPMMAGYMVAGLLNRNRYNPYYSSPLYSSRGSWYSSDGISYGSTSRSTIRTSSQDYNPKPKTVRTMSRGGFGSMAHAKSSWSSRSSGGGWGG